MSVKEQVSTILASVKPTKDFTGVDNIIEGGYLDSFELMALIAALSDELGVQIGIEEIVPENFNSVDAIVAMVERLK